MARTAHAGALGFDLLSAVRTCRSAHPAPLDGRIDYCGQVPVEGCALDNNWPDRPVRLDVLEGGRVTGQTVANSCRADLAQAGKESGACSFVFRFEQPPRESLPWSILRWFDSEIANGLIEGINSLVQAAKAKARGYRPASGYVAR